MDYIEKKISEKYGPSCRLCTKLYFHKLTPADMDANDTAEVRVLVAGSTKTVDVDADGTMNYFSGSLIN